MSLLFGDLSDYYFDSDVEVVNEDSSLVLRLTAPSRIWNFFLHEDPNFSLRFPEMTT